MILIMFIVTFVGIIAFAIVGIIYIRNDFGVSLYDALIDPLLEKMPIWTPNGVLRHPKHRAPAFFKEGEEVIFLNTYKRWSYCDDDNTDIVTKGVVKSINTQKGIVCVEFAEYEMPIRCSSALLMHDWELALLKNKPFFRRVYCAGIRGTTPDGLEEAIKKC